MILKILFTFSSEFTFTSSNRLKSKAITPYLLSSILFLLSFFSFAEGTKELMPNSSDFGFVQINDRGRKFATYNAPVLNRLYIHICTPGEIIYFGFKQPDNDISFRLKDPAGTVVVAAQALPASGAGYVANYNQAVAGPQQLVGAAGYNAMSYTSLVDGDYYIEFTNSGNAQRIFDFFDITVAAGSLIKTGRLWSYSWDINTDATANPFTAKMYILSKDSIVTAIDFNGMQPFGAVITANSTGLSNTGNVIADRASKVGDYTLPEYKIFLNDPDPACYPTGSFGTITAPSKVTGCDPANRCINITVNKAGQVELVLDLNGTIGYQPNTADVLIIANVTAGVNCIPWDSKDGNGDIITHTTNIPLQVNYLNGVTHLPLFDVEANPDGYIVELIRPAGAKPKLYWDDAAITAGTALDAKVNLAGCANAAGCHRWRNRGNNSSSETINTWWYPNIVSDNLTFDLPPAVVDADTRNTLGELNDSLICEKISSFQLQGDVSGTSAANWTGGAGTFTPSRNVINPTYAPTLAERNAGSIKLYLSSPVVLGGCPNAKDSIVIRFQKAPVINVGADRMICESTNAISVTATLTNATTGRWSGGNGTFANATNASTNYTVTAADLSAGNINLIFTSTGTRLCAQEDDTIRITFEKAPVIHLSADKTICATNTTLPLTALLTNTTTGIWTGGNGTFSAATNAATNYTITPADVTAGNIDLVFTSTGTRICPQEDDTINITFEKAPVVLLSTDQTICSADKTINLTATLTNALTGIWTGGNGTFSSSTNRTTTYTFSPADITDGNINLIYTSTGNRVCTQEDDTIRLTFNTPVVIEAGEPITICEGTTTVQITATGDNTAALLWSGGNGSFLPDNALTTTYTLAPSELSASQIDLTLTAQKGVCPDSSDVLSIMITAVPSVYAGKDTLICKATNYELIGSGPSGAAFRWYAIPSQTVLSSQNTADIQNIQTAGDYVLEAVTANNCSNTDTISILIYELPVLNPGNSYCLEPGLKLQAHATNIPAVDATYIWSLENTVVQRDEVQSDLDVSVAGNYMLTYKTDGCSKDVYVTVHAKPILTSPDTLSSCEGNPVTLYTTERTGSIYQWFDSNNTLIQNGVSTIIITQNTANTYFVHEKDENGCRNKDSIVAVGTPIPVFSINNAEICVDSIARFEVIPTNLSAAHISQLTYEWKYNAAVVSTSKQFTTGNAGTYTITASLNTCSASDQVDVVVHNLPTSDLPAQYVFCADNGNTVELNAGPAHQYRWIQTNETTQSIAVTTPGTYDVLIYNSHLCKTIASTVVKEECKPTLYISSAFSPNGDNINDFYETFDNHIGSYSITIFNRWGEVIFQSTDKKVFWDGYYKGELMSVGVYPYIIKYEGDTDTYKGPYILEGSVTLIK
jgi:gliding motility-associated-like protein